ncbi:hypothetical protein GIB67_023205 [Kingdonia uniflora]|uniref:CID domain-containing protein n=1 Tax=Kingdonia uniflora TaxID=39325 RepID=A0A7J7MC99_9MAGN|nr:hypothetical protein GIB67_023205 [Kingdonia uniflora]
MEMESSRRLGLKKPRLAESPPQQQQQRDHRVSNGVAAPRVSAVATSVGSSTMAASRFRANERESPNLGNSGVQQNHQELVAQYKDALADLTFNSKPIITNLTIVAGENLHAAKWIAACVCSNIIEVPSDQKLPSLYLLDSIVKNIGRDYIKYFAARLPEVFCKAYRQVDSSIHTGMRHLFGTWRTVFSPTCLQSIAEELGIPSPINGSSSGATTSRPGNQSQRPPQSSIHVNPKVIEARERLQQSCRDPRLSRKDTLNEPVPEKRTSAEYGDYNYSSDLSNHSDLGIRRSSERVAERGGVNLDPRKYQAPPRTAQADPRRQPPPIIGSRSNNKEIKKNWKNSEEEEYIWDETKSRLKDLGESDSSRKDGWAPDDSENLDIEDHLRQPHGEYDIGSQINREGSSSDSLRGQPALGQKPSSTWPSQEPGSIGVSKYLNMALKNSGQSEGYPAPLTGLPTSTTPSLGRSEFQTGTGQSVNGSQDLASLLSTVLGSSGILGQKRQRESNDLVEQEHVLQTQSTVPPQKCDSFTFKPQNNIHSILQNLQSTQSLPSQNMQTSSTAMHFPQLTQRNPISQQPHPELTQSKPSGHTQKPLPQPSILGSPAIMGRSMSGHSNDPSSDVSGQQSTASLLAAIVKSGLLSNNSGTSSGFPKINFDDLGALSSKLKIPPPLPSGPPPTQLQTTSTAMSMPAVRPPLPPGPPPVSSFSSTSMSQTSSVGTSSESNALSSILSKLVAQGVISSPAKEATTANSSIAASSNPSSFTTAPKLSSGETNLPLSESAIKTTALSPSKDIIGIEFKPEILRESHSSVISSLIGDFPHQCGICGLRLELEDQFNRHLEWHSSQKCYRENIVSRKWNVSLEEWVSGVVGSASAGGGLGMTIAEESGVVADENQCVCMLCGEPFEDFYSVVKDEWLYKGAVYMTLSAVDGEMGTTDEIAAKGPIVHANCISPTSLYDLGLSQNVKMEPYDR